MCEQTDGSRFALKAPFQIRIERKASRENFDGDVPPEARVPRAIHLAHSTSTDQHQDLVRAESGASGQRRGFSVVSGLCRKIEKRLFEEAAGALFLHQQLLDQVLQFGFITAGGIEKCTPRLGRHIQSVAKNFLNGLPLLPHLSPSGSNRTTVRPAVPPASTGVRISYGA